MPKIIFLVLNDCSDHTAKHLCSILDSNINCEIQFIVSSQSHMDTFNEKQFDLFFYVIDRNCYNELSHENNLAAVPGIVVLCGSEDQTLAENRSIPFADDFITTPLREIEVVYRIKWLINKVNSEKKSLARKNILQKAGHSQLIGQDPIFIESISNIPQVSDCDATILLTGETGVGKELCARAIHFLSNRSNQPFISVNCGAIPTSLIENELFGHRKGAFTSAHNNQNGIVAEAEGGTLFLDEIDSLPLEAQSKLLRLLQDKTYRPLGQTKDIKANIRVMGATNVDLRQHTQQNRFREDLFYRFTITLKLPALRERAGDIPLLAKCFLKKYQKNIGRRNKTLSLAALQKLMMYSWPGNIRELENIIQQAILLSPSPIIAPQNIEIQDFPFSIEKKELSFVEAKRIAVEKFERGYVTRLLLSHQCNLTQAAKKAKKDRGDFSRLVKKLNLNPKFKEPQLQ